MTDADRIAEVIRARLLALGESAGEVEKRSGLPDGYISSILDGHYPYVRNDMTARIADALGIARDELQVNRRRRRLTPSNDAPEVWGSDDINPETTLRRLRASIDNIDAAVVYMLAERFRCTKAVGELKAAHDMPPADKAREAEQIARLRELADDADLDPDFAEKFLNFIVTEVIRHHEKLQGNG